MKKPKIIQKRTSAKEERIVCSDCEKTIRQYEYMAVFEDGDKQHLDCWRKWEGNNAFVEYGERGLL